MEVAKNIIRHDWSMSEIFKTTFYFRMFAECKSNGLVRCFHKKILYDIKLPEDMIMQKIEKAAIQYKKHILANPEYEEVAIDPMVYYSVKLGKKTYMKPYRVFNGQYVI